MEGLSPARRGMSGTGSNLSPPLLARNYLAHYSLATMPHEVRKFGHWLEVVLRPSSPLTPHRKPTPGADVRKHDFGIVDLSRAFPQAENKLYKSISTCANIPGYR
ncbi:hypothetical protein O3G_MSEX010932 [Manduca sexta]|uniref:Uncharacterized protein n=1 Tax=Manduca sexta TaxID=7130 RepID=A0A921ZIR2_MANSE|nr:hypothetical protein O3G_MSEX010932 [Manduca sexta]